MPSPRRTRANLIDVNGHLRPLMAMTALACLFACNEAPAPPAPADGNETKPSAAATTTAAASAAPGPTSAETTATATASATASAAASATASPVTTTAKPKSPSASTVAHTNTPAPISKASAAPSASASAKPKYDCGGKGQKSCPMQGWMKGAMARALAGGDPAKIARALNTIAAKPVAGMGQWTAIAAEGAAKAKAGDIPGAKQSCKKCHALYQKRYTSTMRDQPW